MTTVVFPGRFQPFHNAHFIIVKRLLRKYDKVIVAIGSCDIRNRNNPFTAEQRKEMIEEAIKSKRLSFAFIPYAPDDRWTEVFLRAVPRSSFDIVFTNNPRVQRQLRKHGIPFICSRPIKRYRFQGRVVRFWNKEWEENVQPAVAKYIKRNHLIPLPSP